AIAVEITDKKPETTERLGTRETALPIAEENKSPRGGAKGAVKESIADDIELSVAVEVRKFCRLEGIHARQRQSGQCGLKRTVNAAQEQDEARVRSARDEVEATVAIEVADGPQGTSALWGRGAAGLEGPVFISQENEQAWDTLRIRACGHH